MKLLPILFPILSVFALNAQEQPPNKLPDIEDAQRNIEYQKLGDLSLKVDLFRPKDRNMDPIPVIVWLHGGGWNHGAKEWIPWREAMFVQSGYCVVSVDYRLSTVAPFPAAVEDCKCAVRFIRKNAQRYGVDPDRIGVFGYSAGGYLALMVGCADAKAGFEGKGGNEDVSSRVQAVCSWEGPTDLTAAPHGPLSDAASKQMWDTATKQFCGGTPSDNPDLYQRASPLTYAAKTNPPILMLHGELDELVEIEQVDAMAKKLGSVGASVKLLRVKNLKHAPQNNPPGNYTPSIDELKRMVLDFFNTQFKATAKR